MEPTIIAAIIASAGGILTGAAMLVSAIITARKDTRTVETESSIGRERAREAELDSLRATIETLQSYDESRRDEIRELRGLQKEEIGDLIKSIVKLDETNALLVREVNRVVAEGVKKDQTILALQKRLDGLEIGGQDDK